MAVVDLAREPIFHLGKVEIRPGTREVVTPSGRQVLEPRVMQVLVVLAQAEEEVVTRDDLTLTCWDGRVVSDDAINRVISKLRQLAEGPAKGAFSIETISKVGYRLVPGEGPAEVVVPAVNAENHPAPTAESAQNIARVRPGILSHKPAVLAALGAALGVAAAIVVGIWSFPPAPPPAVPVAAPSPPSVAVLPFTALDDGRDAQLYADGISSAVADALSQTELNVIAPAQSFRFRGDAKPGAARALRADILVDGEVERVDGKMRVSFRVEDVVSGTILLAHEMQRPISGAKDFPEQVGTFVAGALGWDVSLRTLNANPRLPPKVRSGIFRAVFLCRSDRNPLCAYQVGRELVRLAPDNALTQTVLAIETVHALGRLPEADRPRALATAQGAARVAIRLDPHFGDPYIALGETAPDMATAATYFRRGVAADPDALSVAVYLADHLAQVGQTTEALPIAQRVSGRFDFMPFVSATEIGLLLQLGRTSEARAIIQRARRLWPDNSDRVYIPSSIFARFDFAAAAFQGNLSEAEALLNDAATRPMLQPDGAPPIRADMARALRTHHKEDIDTVSKDCAGYSAVRWFDAQPCVVALTMLGRLDDAFALTIDKWTYGLLFWPQTAPLRADARFQALTEKLGLFAYWKATHSRPDFCASERVPVCQALAQPRDQDTSDAVKPEARAAYLRGRTFLAQRNMRDMLRAADFFRQAVALEPNYADAHASLALTYNLLFQNGQDRDTLIAASSEADIALRLDPNSFDAHLARALNAEAAWNWQEWKPEMDRLVAQYPNSAEVYHFYGDVLQTAGLEELALVAHRRAAALDPHSAVYTSETGDTLHLLRRFEDAATAYRKALLIDPKLTLAMSGLCINLADLGRISEAEQVLNIQLAPLEGGNGPEALECRLVIAKHGHNAAELQRATAAAKEESARGAVPASIVGAGYAFKGDFDAAFLWLEKAADERDPCFFLVMNDPDMPPALKAMPRWATLMRRKEFQDLARLRVEVMAHPPG